MSGSAAWTASSGGKPDWCWWGGGISFRSHRGLFRNMAALAARGGRVLCLAPAEGAFSLPDPSQEALPAGLAVRDQGVIADLGKRLDARGWPPANRIPHSGFILRGRRGPVSVDFDVEDADWVWLDMRYTESGGRLIVCGIRILDPWESHPTPRYLFAGLLEEAAGIHPGNRGREDNGH